MSTKKATQATEQEAPVFDAAYLIANAKHFGTYPEILAGALYGVTAPVTEAQARQLLTDFLEKPITKEV